ncbi:hypothetical protein KC946_01525 [Candidatus Saccharibacteria bacterium]|nr:hypothetical protein [Candidatus Saccharibacteria bacterium]
MNSIALKADTKVFYLSNTISDYRIKKHLMRVETSLNKYSPDSMSIFLLAKRKVTLAYLREYWEMGEYPINTLLNTRTPVFKDEFGNYCAVGYLLSKAGYDELVTEIQHTNNLVKVKDISDTKYVTAIESLGITLEEAAKIQPSYPPGGFGYEPAYSSSSRIFTAILLSAIAVFIFTQLISIMFFKEMNLKLSQKILGFVTLLLFSSLIMLLIVGIVQIGQNI